MASTTSQAASAAPRGLARVASPVSLENLLANYERLTEMVGSLGVIISLPFSAAHPVHSVEPQS